VCPQAAVVVVVPLVAAAMQHNPAT